MLLKWITKSCSWNFTSISEAAEVWRGLALRQQASALTTFWTICLNLSEVFFSLNVVLKIRKTVQHRWYTPLHIALKHLRLTTSQCHAIFTFPKIVLSSSAPEIMWHTEKKQADAQNDRCIWTSKKKKKKRDGVTPDAVMALTFLVQTSIRYHNNSFSLLTCCCFQAKSPTRALYHLSTSRGIQLGILTKQLGTVPQW